MPDPDPESELSFGGASLAKGEMWQSCTTTPSRMKTTSKDVIIVGTDNVDAEFSLAAATPTADKSGQRS